MMAKLQLLSLVLHVVVAEQQMPDAMDTDQMMKTLADLESVARECTSLVAPNGTRDPSTACHPKTVAKMEARIKEVSDSLVPTRQTWSEVFYRASTDPKITVISPVTKTYQDKKFHVSPGPNDAAQGILQRPSPPTGCEVEDWSDFTSGRMALINRGSCPFCKKVENAMRAGAVGAIVDFLEGHETFVMLLTKCPWDPLLGVTEHIPALVIDYETSKEILSSGDDTTNVEVSFQGNLYKVTTNVTNLILDLPGGDKDNVVIVGAHAYSDIASPGINHNGSGMAMLLELARAFMQRFGDKGGGLVNSFRLCWWGHVGGSGTEQYLQSLSEWERKRILLYLNIDHVASVNGINGVKQGSQDPNSPNESAYITEQFETAFKGRGEAVAERNLAGIADYGKFFDAGIPIGGITTEAVGLKTAEQARLFGGQAGVATDVCYDQPCDTLENIDRVRYLLMAQVTAEVVQKFLLQADLPALFGKKAAWHKYFWWILAGLLLVSLAVVGLLVFRTGPRTSQDGQALEMGEGLKTDT